ncbi:ABC transporter F family member 4-like [Harpegnathos saltator]|uniref:ABC transporter F family member 4-like n=1 Tax=Harpegnathos saltator TaxID=610380 RepID=UPI000DBEE36A|nr:ABC transporter F family member 4-like [Harpegnathos saltator]
MTDFLTSSIYDTSDSEIIKTTQAKSKDTRSRPGKSQVTVRREGLRSTRLLETKKADETDNSDRSRSPIKVDDSTPFATSKEEDSDDGDEVTIKKEGKWEIPRDEDGNTDEERLVEKVTRGRGRPETTGGYRLKKEFMTRKLAIMEQKREETLLKGLENPMEEFQDCTSNRKYKAEIKRLTEHLEEAPFRDITATILEASAKVLGFSQNSKSLKGTHVKVLRDAAAAITAGANVLAMQMAQNKCGGNLDLIEELRTENVGLKTSLNEVRKELEEVKEMLRGIREAPLQVAVSSPPSKQPGNADQSVKKAQQHMAGAPSPLVRVEKERAITPPMVDMMEEEEIPVEVIEVQKGLIPREKRRPIKEARVAKAVEAGPKIREDILLNKKVRLERKKEEPTKKGLEEEVSKMVLKALNKWSTQEKETPKRGAGKGNKESKGKGMEKESVPHGGKNYMQEYPQLPPTREQRREHQEQIEKERAPTPQGEKWSKVIGRREKKKEKEEKKRQEIRKVVKTERKEEKKVKRRVPNTAAVTVTAERGQYKDLLAEAKRKVDLTGIGIEKIKTRVGATGALILEIPGEERGKQADLLAEKLKEVLTDRAKVSRPQKMGELRIKGMEISTTENEAAEVVARVGGCRVGEVKTGKMREAWNTYRTYGYNAPSRRRRKLPN